MFSTLCGVQEVSLYLNRSCWRQLSCKGLLPPHVQRKANPDKKPSWCSAGTWQRGYWCLLKSLTLEEKKIKKRMTAEAWPRMQARHFHSWILSSSYGLRKVSYVGNIKQLDRTVKCRSLYWGRQHRTDAHLLCSGASYWCHGVRTASCCFLFARSPGNCNS